MAIALNTQQAARQDAGFTLVEILCVLAVLGLTAGLVVLNLPRGEDPFKAEMENFAARLNIAARNSAIDGRIRGVEIDAQGYDILEYSGEWIKLADGEWTDAFGVELKIEDTVVDLKERAKIISKTEDKIATPLIHLDPMSGVTPFELEIEGRETTYRLMPDARGRIIADIAP